MYRHSSGSRAVLVFTRDSMYAPYYAKGVLAIVGAVCLSVRLSVSLSVCQTLV